jgi:hypothetical protein
MTPEQWARRLVYYREHAENEKRRSDDLLCDLPLENDRLHDLPLFAVIPPVEEDVVSQELFMSRWSLDDLLRVDPELHEALLDQRCQLEDAVGEEDIELHAGAMERGWVAALKRMEDEEIARARAVFPDAVIRIREK